MRIRELSLENFQGVSAKQTVHLGNFSLIFGENSAGKSSIARALLLLSQSLHGSPTIKNESAIGFFNFSGQLIDLAGFRNVVHKHDDKLQVSMGVTIDFDGSQQDLLTTRLFLNRRKEVDLQNEIVKVTATGFQVVESVTGLERFILFSEFMHMDKLESLQVEFERNAGKFLRLVEARETSNSATKALLGLGQDSALNLSDLKETEYGLLRSWPSLKVSRKESSETGISKSSHYRSSLRYSRKDIFEAGPSRALLYRSFEDWLGFSGYQIRRYFANPSHIPSLREIEPRVTLRSAGSPKFSSHRKSEKISKAATSVYLNQLTNGRYEIEETSHEMGESGFLGEVEVKFLRDKKLGVAVSFQDVGVGLSQVLPLLLKLDLQDKNSDENLIIAEQPELHLHPKMQAELAELMFFKAQQSGQIIAETHSEAMLLRVQRLLRKDQESLGRQQKVSIVYATFDSEVGTRFTNIELRQDLDFLVEFPESFSDLRMGEME